MYVLNFYSGNFPKIAMINLESVRDGLPVGGIHRVLGILQVTKYYYYSCYYSCTHF